MHHEQFLRPLTDDTTRSVCLRDVVPHGDDTPRNQTLSVSGTIRVPRCTTVPKGSPATHTIFTMCPTTTTMTPVYCGLSLVCLLAKRGAEGGGGFTYPAKLISTDPSGYWPATSLHLEVSSSQTAKRGITREQNHEEEHKLSCNFLPLELVWGLLEYCPRKFEMRLTRWAKRVAAAIVVPEVESNEAIGASLQSMARLFANLSSAYDVIASSWRCGFHGCGFAPHRHEANLFQG